jgi:hypothetical protein
LGRDSFTIARWGQKHSKFSSGVLAYPCHHCRLISTWSQDKRGIQAEVILFHIFCFLPKSACFGALARVFCAEFRFAVFRRSGLLGSYSAILEAELCQASSVMNME